MRLNVRNRSYKTDYAIQFGQNSTGCNCYDTHAAPAGKYEIMIPVCLSEQDADYGQKAFDAYGSFDLPAANGTVDVVLAAPGL
jgi:hypothetical protein